MTGLIGAVLAARWGQALVVALLAVFATAGAVAGPAYQRAAQQSVVEAEVASATALERTIQITAVPAADWSGEDLAWFAQRLALRTASDLAVMGHTHVPVGGLAVSPANYVNGGYECTARPDMPPKEFTFTQVDLERATALVLAVHGSPGAFSVMPARAFGPLNRARAARGVRSARLRPSP